MVADMDDNMSIASDNRSPASPPYTDSGHRRKTLPAGTAIWISPYLCATQLPRCVDSNSPKNLLPKLHRDVDLVGLRTASTVMQMQVISMGECLNAPNEPPQQKLEMYVFSVYVRPNKERRRILKIISASGLMYR